MKFSEYEIGTTRKSFSRTITEADIVIHAGQTGDFYPHHMDAEWCATQPFGKRMAHGTLILSVGIGMTAGEINPDAMSYGYEKVRFIKPVFIGDTITVTSEIIDSRDHPKKNDQFGFIDEKVTITNQKNEVVLSLFKIYIVNR
jgi:acyl dehydratase